MHSADRFLKIPTTVQMAKEMGWAPVDEFVPCEPGLGVLWAQSSFGITHDLSLAVWFTPYGQISGVQQNIFGHAEDGVSGGKDRTAAQLNLVK